VWGPIEQPYWTSTFGVVAKHVGGPILAPGGPDPFRFGEPGSLPRVLREAGVRDVSEETRMIEWTWLGPAEEVWDYAKSVSTPFQAMLKRVPTEKWDDVNRDVYKAIGQYVRADKIEFGAMVHLVSGVR
jgi:hypothetical protein